jgi:hypothetical protein
MNWRLWGPLIFAGILFVVASAIRLIAFEEVSFYFDLPSDFSLWATGVLFSFAVSEQALFGGRAVYDIRKDSRGDGFMMNFRVALPDQLEFSPRMIYLFMICMAIWVLNLLLAGKAKHLVSVDHGVSLLAGALVISALALAGLSVGIAARALREVG